MNTVTWILICLAIVIFIIGMVIPKKGGDRNPVKESFEKTQNKTENADNLTVTSYKIVAPLHIQACERLLLYVERIQFPVLVKRLYQPGITRDDLQFSLMQNIQDEFEHNLAQRLYVTENTWKYVSLTKDSALEAVNSVFAENPDADNATVATILSSMKNDYAEDAIINIKREFSLLLV